MIGGGGVGWSGDVNGDGIQDLLVSSSVEGRIYIVFGLANNASFPRPYNLDDVNGLTGSMLYLSEHAWYDDAGFDIRGAGDINADGIDDIIIGAPLMYGNDGSRLNITFGAGQAWVVYGKLSWPVSLALDTELTPQQGFVLNASLGLSWAGFSVSGAGDVDNDGIDDLLISVPAYNLAWNNLTFGNYSFEEVANRSGSCFLMFGRSYADPFPLYVTLDNETFNGTFGVMYPLIAPEIVSSVSGLGDVNGDGIDDFAFASRIIDINDTIQSQVDGRVFVIFGNANRSMLSLEPTTDLDGTNGFIFETTWTDTHPISGAGDFNGDGFKDIVVGRGQLTYVLWGMNSAVTPWPPVLTMGDLFNLTWGATFKSIYYGGAFHRSVGGAGDVNLDGYDDIIIGCAYGGDEAAGTIYVVFGMPTANITYIDGADYVNLDDLPAVAGFTINGAAVENNAGSTVAIVGDVTGDSYADVMIGANWAGDWPEDYIKPVGESYLILGAPTTSFSPAPLELSKLS